MKYYPALWYDIGPETAAARNALFGFRAQLYAENFIGRIAAWCAAHGIDMAGHSGTRRKCVTRLLSTAI